MSDRIARPLVLLAEDEDLIRVELQEALEAAGFDVVIAKSGAEALALIDAEGDAIRALVTDIDLGGGPTGWDVAHAARERNAGLAVVYATSSTQADWAVSGVPKSVLVTKPFATTQIVVAVSELLNSDAPPPSV